MVEICAGSGRIAATGKEFGMQSFAMDVPWLYMSNISRNNANIRSLIVCGLGPLLQAPRSDAAGRNAADDAGFETNGPIRPSLDPGLHLNLASVLGCVFNC